MCVCSNYLKPLGQLKPKFMLYDHGIGEKVDSVFKSSVVIYYCQSERGGGGSWALKFEKLKAPLFPDPEMAGDSNDWCINTR